MEVLGGAMDNKDSKRARERERETTEKKRGNEQTLELPQQRNICR